MALPLKVSADAYCLSANELGNEHVVSLLG